MGAARVLTRRALLQAAGRLLVAVGLPWLSACGAGPAAPTPAPSPTPVPRPGPEQVAAAFARAWSEGRYDDMYALVSTATRMRLDQEHFVGRYRAIAAEARLTAVAAAVVPTAQPGGGGEHVPMHVRLQSSAVGEIVEDHDLPLVQDVGPTATPAEPGAPTPAPAAPGEWRIEWTPSLIFKDLSGDNLIHLFSVTPARGSIWDRGHVALAVAGTVITVGVVPGQVRDEAALLATLSKRLGMPPDAIKARISGGQPDWFMPVRDLPQSTPDAVRQELLAQPGVELRDKAQRTYPNHTLAAHVLGFLSEVNADDLKRLGARGYEEGDVIGRSGIEAGMEEQLAGEPERRLTVTSPRGEVLKTIAQRPGKPGEDVHLTLSAPLQQKVEDALGPRVGSVVVIDPATGAVLAMASHPSFDPNPFVTGISAADWKKISENPQKPLLNRVTSATYPSGSIFKVITMGAGLEKGGFSRGSSFTCTGTWYGLGRNAPRKCWKAGGHGAIDLFQGLVQSCDVVFYEVGKRLNEIDDHLLPEFARACGLGKATGLQGLSEVEGLVPDPEWKRKARNDGWAVGDAINLAIGQGFLLVTPLQMANLYAAIANGGSLKRPAVVGGVTDAGAATPPFTPTEAVRLPITPANLATIREALAAVTSDPRGTASLVFKNFKIPVAGKTGTAENRAYNPHAWFVAYAPRDAPRLVVLCMIEESGEGSEVAAPIVRKVLEGAGL